MWPFTREDMGDDARDHVIIHAREGVEPREVVEDYGDHDRDHDEDTHAKADGRTGDDRIEEFYLSNQTGTIDLK